MPDELRVCYVVNAIDGGSIPGEVAAAVSERTSFDVDVLAWFDANPVPGMEISIECLDAPQTALGADSRTLRTLRRRLRRYDLVHVHHNHSGAIAKLVAAAEGTPLVSTEHNEHHGFTRQGRLANGLTNPLADRITCVSAAVHDSFRRWERLLLDEEQVEIIHNGVDIERIDRVRSDDENPFDDWPGTAFVVASGGKLAAQKGYDTLIRGIAAANRRLDYPIELRLTGDGPLRQELETLVEQLGVADRVEFLGFLPDREDVYRVMAGADLYAVPSRWEGFCVAVPEAMATGTPCLLSDISVFRELYGGAAAFHAVDDAAALADELVGLAENPARRTRLVETGRGLVTSRYTLAATAHWYARTYRDVLGMEPA
jgi:glycosyltransferase involved in cell wall biosynthesis